MIETEMKYVTTAVISFVLGILATLVVMGPGVTDHQTGGPTTIAKEKLK